MTLSIKEQIEGFLACMFPVTETNARRLITELESCRNDWPQLANDWNKRSVFAQIYLSLSEAYFKLGNYEKAGELKTNRVEMFGKLLALAEQNKHINQYQ